MNFSATPQIYLNLGCGYDIRTGYINIDINPEHRPDVVCDVTWLKPFPDFCAIEVLAQDILEHLPREKCLSSLQEWNRVLAKEGHLRLRVPNVIGLLGLFLKPVNASLEAQNILIRNLFGTQRYNGDFHYNGFTRITLDAYLEKSGFIIDSIEEIDNWLFNVVAIKKEHVPPAPILRIESEDSFISEAYKQLLNREADHEGKVYYGMLLKTGISREAIIDSIKSSDEYSVANRRLR